MTPYQIQRQFLKVQLSAKNVAETAAAMARIRLAEKAGWKNIGADPAGKLVGLPPTAQSPCDYEDIPTIFDY